jgi:O-antigen/teichoic acid export membrane protein
MRFCVTTSAGTSDGARDHTSERSLKHRSWMSEHGTSPSLGDQEAGAGIDPSNNHHEVRSLAREGTAELRSKALSAVALVAGRNIIIKVAALFGNIAFARLLSPTDFGMVAFGLTILVFVQLLSDGGLGVGLIRRPEEPHPDDLRVLLGFQILLTTILGVAVATVGAFGPFGRPGFVTAVMMPALPLLAFRAPSAIVFERNLNYGPLVRVEVVEELSFYGWGITTILLGAGVWGLATAAVVKALVGTVAMLRVSPVARMAPTYSWHRLRPLLGFGVKFQGVNLVNTGGLQLLNFGIAGIGGLAVLGLWALAWRLAQLPYLLFGTLWRVSFPAAAQLLAAGESGRKMIERGLALAAVATGAILAPATGSISPLVPAVFGHRWAPVGEVLPIAFFALQVSGPVSVASAGYLYAVGDTSSILRAATATSVVWVIVTLPLLPSLGVLAVGVGWAVSSFIEIPIMAIPARRRTGADYVRPLLMPWIAATVAGASGWLVSRTFAHGFLAACAGGSVSACAYAAPIFLLRRDTVRRIMRLAGRRKGTP